MNTTKPNNLQLPPHTLNPTPHTLPKAFALVEVLIAIFILAIGMVSIATIFPVAIHQSRQATDDVLGQMVGEQALALLKAKGIRAARMIGGNDYAAATNFPEDGSLYTPWGPIEGLVQPTNNPAGILSFDPGSPSVGPTAPGQPPAVFAIPDTNPPQFITANEMIWPAPSFLPNFSLPTVKARRLAFPETERNPQYAWKVMLHKPQPSSPLSAIVMVYRVNNWDAYWNGQWAGVFPKFEDSKIPPPPEHLVPGNILIKTRATNPSTGLAADDLGTPWRITRTRRSDSNSPTQRFRDMLPEGVAHDPTLGNQNVQLLFLPDTALGRFRPVAVVTGPID